MIHEIFNKLIHDYKINYSVSSMDGKDYDMVVYPPDGSLGLDLKVTNKTTWNQFVEMLNAEYVRRKKLKVEYYWRLADTLSDDVEMPLI